MTGAQTSVGGVQDAVVTSKDKMLIFIPGVDTPISLAQGGVTYTWNADNNSSQSVDSGLYYIKFEQKDQFGHSNVFIKQVQVIKEEEYVELNIFNSSGELVRTISGKTPADLNILSAKDMEIKVSDARTNKVSDVVAIDKTGTQINITYGPDTSNDIISWNGMNNIGEAVSSGTYEMQVVVKTLAGVSVEASKTVVVLNEGKTDISNIKILPNPYQGKTRTNIAVTWKSSGVGFVDVKIFNSVGELVRSINTKLETDGILWDMKTASGDDVAQGYYICVIQARDSNGYSDRKIEKLVIEK
jgi:flagellar hook assembly protein FlgD